jgi:hypothetical protein
MWSRSTTENLESLVSPFEGFASDRPGTGLVEPQSGRATDPAEFVLAFPIVGLVLAVKAPDRMVGHGRPGDRVVGHGPGRGGSALLTCGLLRHHHPPSGPRSLSGVDRPTLQPSPVGGETSSWFVRSLTPRSAGQVLPDLLRLAATRPPPGWMRAVRGSWLRPGRWGPPNAT